MRNKYLVAQAVGGIMEQPEITYENPQVIVATSKKEAADIYDKKYSCYYFHGSVRDTLGFTLDKVTDSEPVNPQREKEKQDWLRK